MKLLLDTHVFLWFISGDGKLKPELREVIQDTSHEIYVSVASIWEAVIKSQLGKLPLPQPAAVYLPESGSDIESRAWRSTRRPLSSSPNCRRFIAIPLIAS